MTPDEAVRHEWLQPSANSSYKQVIHKECNDNSSPLQHQQQQAQPVQTVSIKPQKYFTPPSIVTSRQLHQTQQIILPEVKAKPSSNYKFYKVDRTKGN